MAGLLGLGLGAAMGLAGHYEREQSAKRMQANNAVIGLAQAHPEIFANHPEMMKALQKSTGGSPFADFIGEAGKALQAKATGVSQEIQSALPGGGGAGAPAAGAPAGAPSGVFDPKQAQATMQQYDDTIGKLQALVAKHVADPAYKDAIAHTQSLITAFQQRRNQLSTEIFQHTEHEETRTFQEEQKKEQRQFMDVEQSANRAVREESIRNAKTAHDDAEAARKDALKARTDSERRNHFDAAMRSYEKVVNTFTDPAHPKEFSNKDDAQKVVDAHNKIIDGAEKKWSKLTDTSDTDFDSYRLKVETVPGTVYGATYRLAPLGTGEAGAGAEIKAAGVKTDWSDKYK